MAFIARPVGGTLLRKAREAVVEPYPGQDRFDPDFPVVMRCEECGKLGMAPRHLVSQAMYEHHNSDCPSRKTKPDAPNVTRIFYPKNSL